MVTMRNNPCSLREEESLDFNYKWKAVFSRPMVFRPLRRKVDFAWLE